MAPAEQLAEVSTLGGRTTRIDGAKPGGLQLFGTKAKVAAGPRRLTVVWSERHHNGAQYTHRTEYVYEFTFDFKGGHRYDVGTVPGTGEFAVTDLGEKVRYALVGDRWVPRPWVLAPMWGESPGAGP